MGAFRAMWSAYNTRQGMEICFSGCSTRVFSAFLLHLGAEVGAHLSLIALAEYLVINQGNVGISAKELQCLIRGVVLSDDPSK